MSKAVLQKLQVTFGAAILETHSQFGEPRNYGLQLGYKFGGGK